MRSIRYAALAGLLAFAAAAHAVPVTCERVDSADGGMSLVCKGVNVTPTPPTPPAPPVVPVTPPDPPAPPPPPETDLASGCKPGESVFLCWYRQSNSGPSAGSGPSAPPATAGNGTSFEDATYDFRDGAIRRFVGSGSKSAIATKNTVVSFSIGDSGGNAALTWRISVAVNGREVYATTASTYQVAPPTGVFVHTGDVITLTITGDRVVASARLALS